MLVTTESVGAATDPAPIMLASHDEGSKFGIHGAGLLDGVGAAAGIDKGSAGIERSLDWAMVDVSSRVSVCVEVRSALGGPRTFVSVVLE